MPASALKQTSSGRGHLKRSHEPWEPQSHQQNHCYASDNNSRGLDSNELEKIADGVEKMVMSWSQCKEERGKEYEKVRTSLGEDTLQFQKEAAKLNQELSPSRAEKKPNQIATEVNVSYSRSNSPSKANGNNRHEIKKHDDTSTTKDGEKTYRVFKSGVNGDQELQLSLSHRKFLDSNAVESKKGEGTKCCEAERDCCRDFDGSGHEIKLPALDGINFKGLESRLATLNNQCFASTFKSRSVPCAPTQPICREIEDLRIQLLETQVQSELKIIEMKLDLVRRMQHPQPKQPCAFDLNYEQNLALTNFEEDRSDMMPRWDCGQLAKLHQEKKTLIRELCTLKKRERQFDLQKRNLDTAIQRVNRLQRLLSKKEEELIDSQLREKELKVQLDDICCKDIGGKTQIEPTNFLHLVSSIIDWLRSLRKDTSKECTYPDCCRHPDCCPHAKNDFHLECCTKEYADLLSGGCNQWPTKLGASQINSIVRGLNREVQALQDELSQTELALQ